VIDTHLTPEDVARYPRPGMDAPRTLTFTPDGRKVAYLASSAGTLTQDLWTYEIATGVRRQLTDVAAANGAAGETRSLDEDLRRERGRTRETGVTAYQFARSGDEGPIVLLVPLQGRLLIARGDEELAPLATPEGAVDARLSPNGSRLAFVREGDLYITPVDGSASPRRLTIGAADGITNGLAEYIADEEMGRHEGYWWSADGARIAYIHADSSHIPQYPIVHQGREDLAVEWHRYPFAGGRNATLRLGVIPADGTPTDVIWMDLGTDEDIYLARVAWRPDGVLTAQIEARDQRTLRLVAFDTRTGAATTLIEEHANPWINLSDDTRFLASGEIIWSSEHSGFRHLYLHDRDGHEIRALTAGDWMVTGVAGVDEARRIAYVHATAEGVLERHLYAVPLDGGEPGRLTRGAGWHETVLSPDHAHFMDTWSSRERPPRVALCDLAVGTELAVMHEHPEITPAALGLVLPELATLSNRDGTPLHAAIYATEATRVAGTPRPLLVSVYGGPHAQMVTDSWALSVDMRAQYLAQQGFVVLKVDNRGSANRGLAFEAPLAGRMGHPEVEDQVDGVRWLADRPYVDPERVGIYGWSYGGYMVCRVLILASEVFCAGVAGAPVTDWQGYDSHYTERYMGTPAANPEGYRASAVLPHVEALGGDLLIVHGLVDENVHARHSMRLITALIQAAKPYELALFPEERHMPRDPADLAYLERRIAEFLCRHLG